MSAAAAHKNDTISLSKTTAVVALFLMITPSIGGAAVTLWRVNEMERRVSALEAYKEETIRMLERIDARTGYLTRRFDEVVDRNNNKP